MDPASVLSNSGVLLGDATQDSRRCPDPLGISWYTESWASRKPTQEDRFSNGRTRLKGTHLRYFAVFDGHGGSQCSEFLRKRMHNAVMKTVRQAPRRRRNADVELKTVVANAMPEAFASLDGEFLATAKRDSLDDGSTALVTMVVGNTPEDLSLVVANAGDCRAVLCRAGELSRHCDALSCRGSLQAIVGCLALRNCRACRACRAHRLCRCRVVPVALPPSSAL